jgi:hypothetical protein
VALPAALMLAERPRAIAVRVPGFHRMRRHGRTRHESV